MTRAEIYRQVDEERSRQNEKWGREGGTLWSSNDHTKMTVLSEEVGEVARAILEDDQENKRTELIQCMAVVAAWLESEREWLSETNEYQLFKIDS